MKEVLDEGGSDLVAIFEINEDLKKGNLKWMVFRVQIIMGVSQDTYTKNSKKGDDVIDRMKSYEVAFCKKLNAKYDEVQFVRVLWTAQKTSITHSLKDHVYVIDSSKMLLLWSPRIRKFVGDAKLDTYGFVEKR